MINKIKDFLKKKQNKNTPKDLPDQIDHLADSSPEDSTGKFKLSELSSESEDFSGTSKLSLRERVTEALSKIKRPRSEGKSFNFSTLLPKSDSLLSPSLSQGIEKFLNRSSREHIHQVALVLMVCSVTYTLGKVTALVMRGTPALDTAKDFTVSIPLDEAFNPATLAQVKSINIFRTNAGLGGKKNIVADKKCESAEQRSTLPIKLVNTIVLQDTVKSLASVQVRGERLLQEVRVGDQISTIAKIFKITRLEILVKNLESGMCESIASDNKTIERSSPISVMSPAQSRDYKANKKISGIENVGNKFGISKALLDDKLKDIANVLTQARAVKIQNPDGSISFKMTELDPQGIFPYLGIQDQDIITSINGKPIYDMNEVMNLFGRIKNLDNLSLGIKREGTDSVQDYSIKK